MNKKYFGAFFLTIVLITSGAVATAHAETQAPAGAPSGRHGMMEGRKMGMHKPVVMGTVSAINGNMLTVISKGMSSNATEMTYTVDATNAKVEKNRATSTVAAIAVGNAVAVEGTLTGTTVTATNIHANDKVKMEGNGQPLVGGTVTAVNGTTLTITNKSNATYTIDASAAKITKTGQASTIAGIAVGDAVMVQGTITGTNVVAATIADHGAPTVQSGTTNTTTAKTHKGMMGKFGGFFGRIFGF